jgi:hypothetical protein
MEQATLIKIARLRTLSARHGKPFDVVRFATDAASRATPCSRSWTPIRKTCWCWVWT